MFTGQIATFTNREDWEFPPLDIIDDDTGDLIDLSTSTITYGIYDADRCQRLTGSTDEGSVTLIGTTAFQILIPRSSVTNLCPGSYSMGITLENADQTTSTFSGSIAVLDGNVPA